MKQRRIDELWAHVHWLGVLAGAGSYTAAAQRLGVSKAAMSQRVAELERAAGLPLVRRTTRSVRLTEAGQQLVDATQTAFAAIERSFAGVRDLAAEPGGVLRVTAPVALGRQHLVPLLPRFLAQHPQLRLELDLSDQLHSLAKEGFDLAIRHVDGVPETHVAWTLCETQAVLAAAPGYLETHGQPAHPAELATHRCLHYLRPGESPTWSFLPARGRQQRLSVPVRGPFAANNSEALRELAEAGAGIALLPDFSAAGALTAGRLQRVLPDWKCVGRFGSHIHAIRPYSPHTPRAVTAFVAYLRQQLREGFRLPRHPPEPGSQGQHGSP